ncbi:MAG TPA: hypothetical protein VKU00_31825 [Chthonomonadaceae bacterium]|nr:hypothetical protein [Chthonomonadaceae bacterium]
MMGTLEVLLALFATIITKPFRIGKGRGIMIQPPRPTGGTTGIETNPYGPDAILDHGRPGDPQKDKEKQAKQTEYSVKQNQAKYPENMHIIRS